MKPAASLFNPDPSQASRLRPFLQMGDPLADEVVAEMSTMPREQRENLIGMVLDHDQTPDNLPESWRRLLDQAHHIPLWVDWKTMSRGSRAFLRSGSLGMFVLGCYVTPLFYCLANGNKALSFSGNLKSRASRRGRETARFVIDTCLPNNLRRHGDGFKITLRVRLMHAQVRRTIAQHGGWDYAQFGTPINQVYMASMMSLLSAHWIEGLRVLGLKFTPAEEEGLMQLWRYSSYLIGVHPELLFATKQEAIRFFHLVLEQEPKPDDDARALVQSLLEAIPQVMGFTGKARERMFAYCEGLAVTLMGDRLADDLQLRRTPWRHMPLLLRTMIPFWGLVEKILPASRKYAQFHGADLWLQMAEYPPQGGLEMYAATKGPSQQPVSPAAKK